VHQSLPDRLSLRPRLLFVGINPGLRSAAVGHHFAGYSNRFWLLLREAGLVPAAFTFEDDRRLPELGLGITNLIARPTAGIDTLTKQEYVDGLRILRRKIRRLHPVIVAFVGVSLYRFVGSVRGPLALGERADRFEGARVFVLPNPSGRNANFSYAQMLDAFRALAAAAHAR
jgi:TDG/mug DNA glycosylase family protein